MAGTVASAVRHVSLFSARSRGTVEAMSTYASLAMTILLSTCLAACGAGTSDAGPRPPSSGDEPLGGDAFIAIKRFILAKGDRQTFGNMYNRNPHYAFDGFDAFLIPDVGQANINCDPARSDFDGIVIRTNRIDGPTYDEVRHDRVRGRIVVVSGDARRSHALVEAMWRTASR